MDKPLLLSDVWRFFRAYVCESEAFGSDGKATIYYCREWKSKGKQHETGKGSETDLCISDATLN